MIPTWPANPRAFTEEDLRQMRIDNAIATQAVAGWANDHHYVPIMPCLRAAGKEFGLIYKVIPCHQI